MEEEKETFSCKRPEFIHKYFRRNEKETKKKEKERIIEDKYKCVYVYVFTFSYVSNISNKTATKASMVIVFAQYSPM